MKKALLSVLLLFVVNASIPQSQATDLQSQLSRLTGIIGQANTAVRTFTTGTRYVNLGLAIGKAVSLQLEILRKYNTMLSMNYYAQNKNFIQAFREADAEVAKYLASAQDKQKEIAAALDICQSIISLWSADKLTVEGLLNTAIGIGSALVSSGLLGGSDAKEKPAPPDPQKVLENIKMNNDNVEQAYKYIDKATEMMQKLDNELDFMDGLTTQERELKSSSKYLIF